MSGSDTQASNPNPVKSIQCPMCNGSGEVSPDTEFMTGGFASDLRESATKERERCLRIVQHAREQGEGDMRQVRNWIESGDECPEEA